MTPRGVKPFIRRCPTCGGRWAPLRGAEAKAIRKAKKMTVYDIAAVFEVTAGYISKLENEVTPMSRFMAAKYEALRTPPSEGPKSRV
jgi:transcriptional regulator with XRE-family HTH domain